MQSTAKLQEGEDSLSVMIQYYCKMCVDTCILHNCSRASLVTKNLPSAVLHMYPDFSKYFTFNCKTQQNHSQYLFEITQVVL